MTDGLLGAGEAGVQLTWMDAKVGDWVVTPRQGKPVEIQALWYNALQVMEELAANLTTRRTRMLYAEMASRAHASFNESFWNEEASAVSSTWLTEMTRDASIRPNQIFAVSLHHSMLSHDKAQRMLETVERELLTPYGLRSLAPDDPQYRPRYEGDSLSRDGAYHQGTVWAWLMGPFITAYIKAHDKSDERARAGAQVARKFPHTLERGRLRTHLGDIRWRRAASSQRLYRSGVERGGGVARRSRRR